MYFSGQKPLHLSIKIGNKKLIKLIEYYETRSPTSKPTEGQKKIDKIKDKQPSTKHYTEN
jgi:hypothetical protein